VREKVVEGVPQGAELKLTKKNNQRPYTSKEHASGGKEVYSGKSRGTTIREKVNYSSKK